MRAPYEPGSGEFVEPGEALGEANPFALTAARAHAIGTDSIDLPNEAPFAGATAPFLPPVDGSDPPHHAMTAPTDQPHPLYRESVATRAALAQTAPPDQQEDKIRQEKKRAKRMLRAASTNPSAQGGQQMIVQSSEAPASVSSTTTKQSNGEMDWTPAWVLLGLMGVVGASASIGIIISKQNRTITEI